MIAFLASLAIRAGASSKYARAIAIAGLVVLGIVGLGVAKCSYDRSVIEHHEAGQAAATAKADRKADRKAAEGRRADDARIAHEAAELEKAAANATNDVDRRLAKHRCIRLQSAARAEQREPPACS